MMTNMTTRKYILSFFLLLAGMTCRGQAPADSVKADLPAIRDSLKATDAYSDIYLDTV